MSTSLPQSFDEAIQQAQLAVRLALKDGRTRLQVEIQSTRRSSVGLAQPLTNVVPQPLTVVFGVGNADVAFNTWGEVPHNLLNIGERDFLGDTWQALVLIDASSIDVEEVERYADQAQKRPFLMINNWPEAPTQTGIGRGSERRRQQFRSTVEVAYFLQAFRYRPAVLFRQYPAPWQIWEGEGEYRLRAESEQPFTIKDLPSERLLNPLRSADLLFRGPLFFRTW